ncbi:hypothetical protein Dsin_018829 [Dipteronia sinensis]|uniref:Uncharacterized protein n=1 Tax=Dipteronia sinensis TaxID=43782 RepID=A0AAE0A7H5_9ROSI|nr:hypothetical protein Dsin_018829 [Dipteronia sinensis]
MGTYLRLKFFIADRRSICSTQDRSTSPSRGTKIEGRLKKCVIHLFLVVESTVVEVFFMSVKKCFLLLFDGDFVGVIMFDEVIVSTFNLLVKNEYYVVVWFDFVA